MRADTRLTGTATRIQYPRAHFVTDRYDHVCPRSLGHILSGIINKSTRVINYLHGFRAPSLVLFAAKPTTANPHFCAHYDVPAPALAAEDSPHAQKTNAGRIDSRWSARTTTGLAQESRYSNPSAQWPMTRHGNEESVFEAHARMRLS